jgi:hypothetical protein
MEPMRTLLLVVGLGSMLMGGCGASLHGIMATDEQSVWVVAEDAVYRCTDTAARGSAPQPVCVRSPMQETAGRTTTAAPTAP